MISAHVSLKDPILKNIKRNFKHKTCWCLHWISASLIVMTRLREVTMSDQEMIWHIIPSS